MVVVGDSAPIEVLCGTEEWCRVTRRCDCGFQRERADFDDDDDDQGGGGGDKQNSGPMCVRALAGKGGNGCASFRKDFGGSRGRRGADGGNGGNGGDVVLKAVGVRGPKSLGHIGNLLRAETEGREEETREERKAR